MPYDFKRAFRLNRSSRSDALASVEEELRHHLELVEDELIEAGWDPENARIEARRRFGDVDETQSYCTDVQTRRGREERRRDMVSFDDIRQDIRYALRSIRRAPGYAGLVIVTLAFGIAANTTMFSVMNPYLFRPLPFGAPDELVQVNQVNPTTGWDMDRFSYPQYEDWKSRSRAFQDLAAYSYGSTNLTDREGPEQIQYARVTANVFDVLDAPPTLGRGFRPEEGLPGAEPVVVLSWGLWQRRYAGDASIVGRAITMDGIQRTVVGVTPRDFNFPFGGVKLWVPAQVDVLTANRASLPWILVGRLSPGWDASRARAELSGIQTELGAQYPDADGRMSGVTIKPLREALNFAWDVLSVLFVVLLGAVGVVLLIACANVASLTLAHGSGRLREVSVRAAMGARRDRIVRQLLTESLVLALAGGSLGVALAYWLTGLLDPVMPEDLFRIGAISIDPTVLAFSLFVTLLTPVAFGLLPALRASNVDLTLGLKEGSKGSHGIAASRGRRILVVTQVALAVILTSGAGLMLRSFLSVQDIDLGFHADRVATAELVLAAEAFPSGEERRAFMTEAVEAVEAVAGVNSASAVRWLPLNHEENAVQVLPARSAGTPAEEWPLATTNRVYPAYFETMGIEVHSGRDFGPLDGVDGQVVAAISRTLAERFWPDGPPLGQTILLGDPESPTEATVVAVVADVRHSDLNGERSSPQIYLPSLQAADRRFFVLASTASEPSSIVGGIRTALGAVAPDLPIVIRPFDDVVAENQLQWSISSVFLSVFGGGALLLATLGIYGLISYSVAQREREIAVRIALGAGSAEIRRGVVSDALRLTATGLVIGLAVAMSISMAVGQSMGAILYDVAPFDPVTFVTVPLLFAAVSALAAFVPATRASRTDPIEALRSE